MAPSEDVELIHALSSAAREDMGIYPMNHFKRDESGELAEYTRTEWQNGWNAAILALTQKESAIHGWWARLDPQLRALLRPLLVPEGLDDDPTLVIREASGAVRLLLPINDTFAYATADVEEVPLDHASLAALGYLRANYGWRGLVAWAALSRGEKPLGQLVDDEYLAALAVATTLLAESKED